MKKLYSAITPDGNTHFTAHPTPEESQGIISSTVVVSPLVSNGKVLCDSKQTYHKLMGVITLSYSLNGYTGVGVAAVKMDGDAVDVKDSIGLTENIVSYKQTGETTVTVQVGDDEKTTTITLSLDEELNPSMTADDSKAEIISPTYSKIIGASGKCVTIVGSGTVQYTKSIWLTTHYYREPFSIQINGNTSVSVASEDRSFITKETKSDSTSVTIPVTNGVSVSTVTIDSVYFECTNANQDKVEVD